VSSKPDRDIVNYYDVSNYTVYVIYTHLFLHTYIWAALQKLTTNNAINR